MQSLPLGSRDSGGNKHPAYWKSREIYCDLFGIKEIRFKLLSHTTLDYVFMHPEGPACWDVLFTEFVEENWISTYLQNGADRIIKACIF